MDQKIRKELITLAEKHLAEFTPRDVLIIQAIHTIDELIIITNKLVTALRERYGYYASKTSKIEDINSLIKEIKKQKREPAGIQFKKQDFDSINEIILSIENLGVIKISQEFYLENLMKEQCPEFLKITGVLVGARLISLANSIKHLAELPSSTIQILGSEKALFRHLKTGSNPPRFGVIFAHPDIQKAREEDKARTARKLASKISIAVKRDYFSKK